MHPRTKVVEPCGRVPVEEEHAGERGNPELGNVPPRIEARVDLEYRSPGRHPSLRSRAPAGPDGLARVATTPRVQVEAEGSGKRRTVEESEEGERSRHRFWPYEPELPEGGKLLSARQTGVHGYASRRQSVHVIWPEQTEVGVSQEPDDLVLARCALQRVVYPESGVTYVRRALVPQGGGFPLIAKAASLEVECSDPVPFHHVDRHRVPILVARMKELDLEERLAVPESFLGSKADGAVLVVGEPIQRSGQGLPRRRVSTLGSALGQGVHLLVERGVGRGDGPGC